MLPSDSSPASADEGKAWPRSSGLRGRSGRDRWRAGGRSGLGGLGALCRFGRLGVFRRLGLGVFGRRLWLWLFVVALALVIYQRQLSTSFL